MPIGLSLHIATTQADPNHYLGWTGSNSVGPLNDADSMRRIADARQFKSQILTRTEATSKAVLDEISAAAARLNSGDIFLLTYAGEGGRIPDINGDEPSHFDSVWALYDRMLIDDELNNVWNKFREGVRIVVVSDSCNSGAITNLAAFSLSTYPGFTIRSMPSDLAYRVYNDKTNKPKYDMLARNSNMKRPIASLLLMASSQDDEPSISNGHGRYTDSLLTIWNNGSFNGTYRDLHRNVYNLILPIQHPVYLPYGTPSAILELREAFTI